MYGLSAGKGENGAAERARARREERERIGLERRAQQTFPGLPLDEALDKYAQLKEGRQSGEELWRDYWPILLAVAGGLVIFTFMKR